MAARHSLRFSIALLFLLSAPLPSRAACEGDGLVSALAKSFGEGAFDFRGFTRRFFVQEPEKQLRPGDIIIYPDKPPKQKGGGGPAAPEDGEADSGLPGGPLLNLAPYKAALQGFGHAAVVARSEKGELYHLDSPWTGPEPLTEFRGGQAYFVVRPKAPEGVSREAFEKRVSDISNLIRRTGFDYDALMRPSFLDEATMANLRKAGGECTAKKGDIPPQYCSGLTQTVLILAGAGPARGTRMEKLLDLAIEKIRTGENGRELDGKELETAATKAVNDTLDMFFGDPAEMEKALKEMEAAAKAEQDPGKKQRIERDIEDIKREIDAAKSGQLMRGLARTLLQATVMAKLRDPEARLPKAVDDRLKSKVIRPIDILSEGLGGGRFEFAGYYPGNLESCVAPRDGGPPEDLPPREAAGPRREDDHR